MIPTLLGIMLLNFVIIQFAPGGPIERTIAQIKGFDTSGTQNITGDSGDEAVAAQKITTQNNAKYQGSKGIEPELIKQLEEFYGFDKPPTERFVQMMLNYLSFDFGNSFYQDRSVIGLIVDKMPVSISLGLWSTLIIYLISIPLGIKKAVRNGTKFDVYTSFIVVIGNAIPGFLFAILLVVLFAGGSFWQIFPLRGLVSDNFDELSTWSQILDYAHHLVLPTLALVIGGFAGITILTKNSFLAEISKQYVLTARAKGLGERDVLYKHVMRNAMLIVIAGIPAALVGILFTGAFMVEVIFSLDGLGLLGYNAVIGRDYPIIFGTLYMFTLLGLVMSLIRDVSYTLIDPRISFEGR